MLLGVFIYEIGAKNTNSNDMMGRFLRTGFVIFVWVAHVINSRNVDPRRRLGDKCKAQLAEPSKQFFEAAAICQKNRRRL